MNKIIDKVTSIGITLALSTTLGLSACAKKQNNYIPMSEVFYDENNEGIDDIFEKRISDSYEKIQDIQKIERSIDLVKKLNEMDFKDVPEINLNISEDEIYFINLDIVESIYEEYQIMTDGKIELTDSHKLEQLQNMKEELYKYYVMLNMYINKYGYSAISRFGKGLYKAIILDTADLCGSEKNVEAKVDISSDKEYHQHTATYRLSEDNFKQFDINSNSNLCTLIRTVGEFENHETPKDSDVYSEYNEEEIEKMEDAIELIKECIYTNYELKHHEFLFAKENDELVSGKINVPTR